MTRSRPAKLKGINDRFELDLEGSCGESCKICREKNYDLNAVLDVMNPNNKRKLFKLQTDKHLERNQT